MITEQINTLETRQHELKALMSKSDEHASKCAKLGLDFSETYPDDLATYKAANAEYNDNEARLKALYEQQAEEQKYDLDLEYQNYDNEL